MSDDNDQNKKIIDWHPVFAHLRQQWLDAAPEGEKRNLGTLSDEIKKRTGHHFYRQHLSSYATGADPRRGPPPDFLIRELLEMTGTALVITGSSIGFVNASDVELGE